MKTEKEKLQAKTVDQLKRYAKKVGANVVDPKTGKAKTKDQLINSIVMKQRLSGKGDSQTGRSNTAKDMTRRAKSPGKRTSSTGKVYYERRANRSDKPGSLLGSNMNIYRAFLVTYVGPSNSRGSRVKIQDLRFRESVTIPYSYSYNRITDMAEEYLKGLGIKVVGQAEFADKGDLLFSNNFEVNIKKSRR